MTIKTIDNKLALTASQHLKTCDPILAPIIGSAGLCPIRPHTNYYWELVDAIISQQLSVKAAASIEGRFREMFASDLPKPKQILEKSIDELRTAGLSRPKAGYIIDLANKIVSGELELNKLEQLSNEAIIRELTAVKGIGEWTAHMFLMFCMARPDVLPVGDLGIRNSIHQLYDFDHLPTTGEITALAENNNWAPFESIASWYIWQNLGNTPEV